MSNSDVQEMEMDLQEAKDMVELGDALNRLRNNPDFKALIENEYLDREAVRLVHLKSDPNMQSQEKQHSIDNDMLAIGSLANFLNLVLQKAEYCREAIEDYRNEISSVEEGED